jgi:hypothetical protein
MKSISEINWNELKLNETKRDDTKRNGRHCSVSAIILLLKIASIMWLRFLSFVDILIMYSIIKIASLAESFSRSHFGMHFSPFV